MTAQRGWARRLAAYAWRHPRNVVLALGSSLAGMAVMALVPLITKVIIDDVIGDKTRDMGTWAASSSPPHSPSTSSRTSAATTADASR